MLKSVPGLLAVALCIGASATTMYAADASGGGSIFRIRHDER